MSARDRKTGALAFLLQIMIEAMEYRRAKAIREIFVCEDYLGVTGFYICPRCDSLLDREFVHFCDRCGQRLDWRFYLQARIRKNFEKGCSEIRSETTLK